MASLYRGFLLAASPLLVLLLASPALAISDFSWYKCDDPSEASDDAYDYFGDYGFSTSNFEEKDCENLCKEVQKICEKNVDSRVKCIKADDRFWFELLDRRCDLDYADDSESRRNCKNSVKSQKDSCKDELNQEKEDGRDNCEETFGRESSCVGDCLDGNFNDD
jgi:hypothetical protein